MAHRVPDVHGRVFHALHKLFEKSFASRDLSTGCVSAGGSSGFFDFSCADAAGADVFPADTTVFDNTYLLDVRTQDSLCLPVGVAHMIPDDRALAAYGTDP